LNLDAISLNFNRLTDKSIHGCSKKGENKKLFPVDLICSPQRRHLKLLNSGLLTEGNFLFIKTLMLLISDIRSNKLQERSGIETRIKSGHPLRASKIIIVWGVSDNE
jgi:hypothetical protein